MVSDLSALSKLSALDLVLILVVMEYGLRLLKRLFFYYCGFETRGFLFSLQTTQKKCIF